MKRSHLDLAEAITTAKAPSIGLPDGMGPSTVIYGVVQSIQAGPPPTLTLTLSGSTKNVAGIAYLSAYNPRTSDIVAILKTGSDLIVLGPAAATAAPTTYTPSWTASSTAPSIGNGTLTGRYIRQGQLCFVSIYCSFRSTTNGANGFWTFGLPFAAAATIEQEIVGKVFCTAPSGQNFSGFATIAPGASSLQIYVPTSPTSTVVQQAQNTDSGGLTGHGVPNTGAVYPYGNGANLIAEGWYLTA